MEYTTRRLIFSIGIIFVLIFAISLIALHGLNDLAFADTEVSYLEYNTSTKVFDTQSTTTYTAIETTTDFSSGGTFVLNDDVTLGTINCNDNNLTLILCDGKTLTVNKITGCDQLTIYAQGQGTGKIVASEDVASGSFISCNDMKIHGGEINSDSHSVFCIIYCNATFEMYNGKIVGIGTDGVCSESDMVIENAIVDLEITDYGLGSYSTITINNGTYNISGLGTAITSEGNTLTINNGNFIFEDVDIGFYSKKDLTFNHGKANILATNEAFYSYDGKVFLRGTRIYAQSEESNVVKADSTITFSYVNFEGVTHSATNGIMYSTHHSTAYSNTNEYYKDTEDGEWYKDNTKNERSPDVKFYKVVANYIPITVWVEDMSAQEGADISTLSITYGFGIWDDREEETLDSYATILSRAATLFSVSVDCDGTTPGTYDYILFFVPTYEGNIDDEYEIKFGNPIGQFTITAAPPASTPDPETPATPEQSSEQANDTPTPNADVPQNDALDESELSDEDIAAIEKFWEEYGCIGLVVIIIDAFMLFDFIYVIMYLLQNKKHPDRKSIKASKILRFIGLALAILALIFAIVAIIIHQCTFSTIGIAWAAINVILFIGSYLVKFKKDEIYG